MGKERVGGMSKVWIIMAIVFFGIGGAIVGLGVDDIMATLSGATGIQKARAILGSGQMCIMPLVSLLISLSLDLSLSLS